MTISALYRSVVEQPGGFRGWGVSEVDAKSIALQKHLHQDCSDDKFLRDRLMNAVDISSIQIKLGDCTRGTAQQPTICNANQLSKKPKIAGSASMNYE